MDDTCEGRMIKIYEGRILDNFGKINLLVSLLHNINEAARLAPSESQACKEIEKVNVKILTEIKALLI